MKPVPATNLITILLALSSWASSVHAVDLPSATGDYITGVHDFEFMDTEHPSDRSEDISGRRIMSRIWYPVCLKADFQEETATCTTSEGATPLGRRRLLFEPGEYEAIGKPQADFMAAFFDQSQLFAEFNGTLTHSYLDAPPLIKNNQQQARASAVGTDLPVIVFSHGAVSFVSQNTAWMEEIASHGFIVVSVTHPGWSSGIMYPNGDTLRYDPEFEMALWNSSLDSTGIFEPNTTVRYLARQQRVLSPYGLAGYVDRGRDDMIAQVDYLESFGNMGEKDEILQSLVGPSLRVVYVGMSYGGCVCASAAQVDERAIGIFNLDGTHWSPDLFGKQIRVPFVTLTTEIGFYSNEFHFEPLSTMGSDETVNRIRLQNVTHYELMDHYAINMEDRKIIPGGGGSLKGDLIHGAIVQSSMTFIQSVIDGTTWSPTETLEQFPSFTEYIDVSHVASWTEEYFATDTYGVEEEVRSKDEEKRPDLSEMDDEASSAIVRFAVWASAANFLSSIVPHLLYF